jgi:hypothetical protein
MVTPRAPSLADSAGQLGKSEFSDLFGAEGSGSSRCDPGSLEDVGAEGGAGEGDGENRAVPAHRCQPDAGGGLVCHGPEATRLTGTLMAP